MLNESRDSAVDQTGSWKSRHETSPAFGPKSRSTKGFACSGTEADVLAALGVAVMCPDRVEAEQRLADVLATGIDKLTLIDKLIPEIARTFGTQWCDDSRSFAQVTIATARLQGWLRELEDRQTTSPFVLDVPEILLVVPAGGHHTLGAMVCMSAFRRLGALVRLSLGQDTREIGQLVRRHHVDMVALSAAGNEDLDFLADVVHSIRSGHGPAPAVVLGGEILNQHADARALVGADHATSDPEEALRLCGLTLSSDHPKPRHSSKVKEHPERMHSEA